MDIINIAQGVMVILGALPELRALGAPRDRPAARAADHRPVDVRARRGDGVLLHAPAARTGSNADVDPGHLRGGDRDRGRPDRDLRGRLPAAAGLLRQLVGPRARLLSALHLPDRLRAGGRAAGRALLRALPHAVRARGARLAAEPHRGRPDRDRRQPRADDLGRDRRGGHGGRAAWCSAPPTRSTPTPATT